MAEYKIDLSDDDLAKVAALAKARGVSANTVIQQAIGTEKLIADNVGKNDKLLIKKDNRIDEIEFGD